MSLPPHEMKLAALPSTMGVLQSSVNCGCRALQVMPCYCRQQLLFIQEALQQPLLLHLTDLPEIGKAGRKEGSQKHNLPLRGFFHSSTLDRFSYC